MIGPDTRQFIERMREKLNKGTVRVKDFRELLNILDLQGEPCTDHGGIGRPGGTQCPKCWEELEAFRKGVK